MQLFLKLCWEVGQHDRVSNPLHYKLLMFTWREKKPAAEGWSPGRQTYQSTCRVGGPGFLLQENGLAETLHRVVPFFAANLKKCGNELAWGTFFFFLYPPSSTLSAHWRKPFTIVIGEQQYKAILSWPSAPQYIGPFICVRTACFLWGDYVKW